MPLPTDAQIVWPPRQWLPVYDQYRLHDAWYSGSADRLANTYASLLLNPLHPTSWEPAASSNIYLLYQTLNMQNAFWARVAQKERASLAHVPVAGDLAATSASLLFGEAPSITIPEGEGDPATIARTSARLNFFCEALALHSRLVEAAESCAALGGVFLKINLEPQLANYPILSVAQVDAAVPEFLHGFLTAVTFWRVTRDDGDGRIWRLLERYERGMIFNGLYEGSINQLGHQIPLTASPDTAQLTPAFATGIDDLLCRYLPNVRPHRLFRKLPIGQSDFAGVESLMDSLDEIYTAWLRDIRLAKGRIIADESMFEAQPDGTRTFDLDREAYMGLHTLVDTSAGLPGQLTVAQFAIRANEFAVTAGDFLRRIYTTAGYAPQSFGLDLDGREESGVALAVKEGKSIATRGRKGRYWTPVIADMLTLLLQVDARHCRSGVEPLRPHVELAATAGPNLLDTAQAVNLLRQAQAASTETLVELLHADWSPQAKSAEVERIQQEQSRAGGQG